MRRDPRKSNDEKQETELAIKVNGQVVLEKAMAKNLTMLDIIALVALTTSLRALAVATLIGSDNLQPKRNTNENEL